MIKTLKLFFQLSPAGNCSDGADSVFFVFFFSFVPNSFLNAIRVVPAGR